MTDEVWTDDHEGSIWIADGDVYFILDKENYEASMSPGEAREFAAKLIEAADRIDKQQREPFANHPVWQRNWIVWKDEQTGEIMRSCVDARDNDRVYVGPLRSIHDPGIMSKADFEARYGASVRKAKK
jgi:hypothetical protein